MILVGENDQFLFTTKNYKQNAHLMGWASLIWLLGAWSYLSYW